MTTNQPLSLFISSKMTELAEERRAVQNALKSYNMFGWLFEKDAGARPESIQQTYLEEVARCDIYIGLFWQGYGQYTIEEFEKARSLHKPCLVYEKHVDMEQRDPQLTTFLRSIQQVTDPSGLTVRRFQTALAHIPQFRERKNRIVNTQDQAGAESVDEELAAPRPAFANVNQCGCARDQCPQNIGKSSASWDDGWVY